MDAPLDRTPHLNLRENFAWSLGGSSIYAAFQWAMLIALAKLGSAETVGLFSLALAVTAPVFMLANLQLRNVQATDARREHTPADYLGLRMMTTVAALAVLAVIVSVGGYGRVAAGVILLLGLAKGFEAVADVVHGYFQARERMDVVARSLVLKGAISLPLLAGAVHFLGSLTLGVAALAAAWLGVLVLFDSRRAARLHLAEGMGRLRICLQGERLRPLLAVTWPLGLSNMLISLTVNVPRFVIESRLGAADLGIFAALAYLMTAGQLAAGALGVAISARLARLLHEDLAAFRRLLLRAVGLGALVGSAGLFVALLWGRPLLTVLYRPLYAEHVDVLVWIMVGTLINTMNWPLDIVVVAARAVRTQLIIRCVVVAAVTAASLLLVPREGIVGGAQALCLALLLQLILNIAAVAAITLRSARRREAATGGGGS